jgi:hypothetical protein
VMARLANEYTPRDLHQQRGVFFLTVTDCGAA